MDAVLVKIVSCQQNVLLANVICRRKSVCLSVSLSVTFVRPTQAIEIFGNISSPFDYFGHPLTPG